MVYCSTVSTKTEKGTWLDAWSRKEYKTFRENRVAREREIEQELAKEKREKFERSVLDNSLRKSYTKINPADILPMDTKQFQRIKNSLEKQGVKVIQDQEGDKFLKAMGAEAMMLSDGTAIIFQSGRIPSRSAVFEEIIHIGQIRKQGIISSTNEINSAAEYLKREIQASEILLKNKKAYKLTELDIKSVEENLKIHRRKLRGLKNV